MPDFRRHPSTEHGSSLLMIPVMVLILFLAAGLVVDSAIAFSAKRDLVEAASAAANDAASSLSERDSYDDGTLVLDRAEVAKRAEQAFRVRANNLGSQTSVNAIVTVGPGGRSIVRVTATSTAHYLFARVVPGRASTIELSATVTSTLRESP